MSELAGIAIMLTAAMGLMGIFGVDTGTFGTIVTSVFTYGFGVGAAVPAVFLLYVGWRVLYEGKGVAVTRRGILVTLFFVVALFFVAAWRVPAGQELSTTQLAHQGGIVGGIGTVVLRAIFGQTGSILVAVVTLLCCVLGITKMSLRTGLHRAKDKTAVGAEKVREVAGERVRRAKDKFVEWREERREAERHAYDREKDMRFTEEDAVPPLISESEYISDIPLVERVTEASADAVPDSGVETYAGEVVDTSNAAFETIDDVADEADAFDETVFEGDASFEYDEEYDGGIEERYIAAAYDSDEIDDAFVGGEVGFIPGIEGTEEDRAAVSVSTEGKKARQFGYPYVYPRLDMLSKGEAPTVTEDAETARKAALLESTLLNFGIKAKVVNATQGPAVTRYELEPAPGTKVSKVVSLTDDLKLALAAADIRMEAPIPGKAAIGIEVPNKSISPVHLRDVLESDDFLRATGGIPVGLGKDITGKPIITDLAKMPHLLVAGSTGSGKSVCINTLIASILFGRKPDEVKLILIDPKMVELSVYEGIPHLMAPVVTDMKKASAVLRWAVREMEARYRTFAESGVRDVKRYNELNPDARMPLILIIIDELADLMMTAGDVEDAIVRLAQMARAAGLHMVLATQRPSVNVITGLIKANVPSRLSFAVATQIDSRTILDMGGAEKLLGKGDMLFNPIGANKPLRIQGAFISDDEVERLVGFMKAQGRPVYDESVTESSEEQVRESGSSAQAIRDELLERAVDLVFETGQASVSNLQRRFRIGYTRAARLVDTMEEMKIVGPNAGSKARDILMTKAQAKELYFGAAAESETERTGHGDDR